GGVAERRFDDVALGLPRPKVPRLRNHADSGARVAGDNISRLEARHKGVEAVDELAGHEPLGRLIALGRRAGNTAQYLHLPEVQLPVRGLLDTAKRGKGFRMNVGVDAGGAEIPRDD